MIPPYDDDMSSRRIVVAILAAALAGVVALTAVSKGHSIEFRLPFGLLLSIVIFGLAVVGNRLAWGVSFAVSVFAAGFGLVFALTASKDQAFGWLGAALFAIVSLALWELMPERRLAGSEHEAGDARG
jgi:hypothetical protein